MPIAPRSCRWPAWRRRSTRSRCCCGWPRRPTAPGARPRDRGQPVPLGGHAVTALLGATTFYWSSSPPAPDWRPEESWATPWARCSRWSWPGVAQLPGIGIVGAAVLVLVTTQRRQAVGALVGAADRLHSRRPHVRDDLLAAAVGAGPLTVRPCAQGAGRRHHSDAGARDSRRRQSWRPRSPGCVGATSPSPPEDQRQPGRLSRTMTPPAREQAGPGTGGVGVVAEGHDVAIVGGGSAGCVLPRAPVERGSVLPGRAARGGP